MIFSAATVDVWVGSFSSKQRFDAYFGETDDADGSTTITAISELLGDMSGFSYGRRLFLYSFYETPKADIEALLRRSYYPESTIMQISSAFALAPKLFNALLKIENSAECSRLTPPISVRKEGIHMRYLGHFDVSSHRAQHSDQAIIEADLP